MMSRLRTAVEGLSGKFVVMTLDHSDGRGIRSNLKAQILGAGPSVFTVSGQSFPWPTTVKYDDVRAIAEDLQS